MIETIDRSTLQTSNASKAPRPADVFAETELVEGTDASPRRFSPFLVEDAERAREIAHRIVAAVGAEDWAALVPGTPVGVTIGWSQATPRGRVADAFAQADREMLRAKAS